MFEFGIWQPCFSALVMDVKFSSRCPVKGMKRTIHLFPVGLFSCVNPTDQTFEVDGIHLLGHKLFVVSIIQFEFQQLNMS